MDGSTPETSINTHVENPITEIPESSQENPSTDTPEPSKETPSPDIVNGFYLEVNPTGLMKLAIEALCHPEFNPSGQGRIDVNENTFEITVVSLDNVFGRLCLFGTDVKNIKCNKSTVGKLVDLRQISQNLVSCDYEDILIVLHQDGSNEISFNFEKEPAKGFAAEFLENSVEVPEFPNVETICHAKIESYSMSHLIEELVKNGNPQLVSIDITKNTATIVVGQERLEHNYETMGVTSGTAGLAEGGQRHHAWFYWPYPNVLRTALHLFRTFAVYFIRNPPHNIMMCFVLQGFGLLTFLREADELTLNIDSIALFPNWMR